MMVVAEMVDMMFLYYGMGENEAAKRYADKIVKSIESTWKNSSHDNPKYHVWHKEATGILNG